MYLAQTKTHIFKIISLCLSFSLIFSSAFPGEALASRSNAGGGDLEEFDVGKWGLGTAVGLASFALGSAVSSGITNAWKAPSGFGASAFSTEFTKSISSLSSLSTWADKYSVFAATTQVSNALGRIGNYYSWDRGTTLFFSSVGSSIVGGGLSPGQFGSSVIGPLNGMALGAINGAVEGAILRAAANEIGKAPSWVGPDERKKLEELPSWVGPLAGLAGAFVTSGIEGGLTPNSSTFSFANSFNFSEALKTAGRSTLLNLPSTALSVGVGYLTEDMEKQDAYILKQAFSGLYPVVSTVTQLQLIQLGIIPLRVPGTIRRLEDGFKVEPPRR